MTNVVLFDLDGTLLPMDQEVFTRAYFKRLAAKLVPLGYEPDKLIDGIWAGIAAMVKNDGACTNEEAFWKCFAGIFGERVYRDRPVFDDYYRREFQEVAAVCGRNPQAKETVDRLKAAGYRLALATNPIFPATATESRIRWAGLEPEDFELYTTYENSETVGMQVFLLTDCLINQKERDLTAYARGGFSDLCGSLNNGSL